MKIALAAGNERTKMAALKVVLDFTMPKSDNAAADSGRSRPRFQDEAARHSEIIPPSIPR